MRRVGTRLFGRLASQTGLISLTGATSGPIGVAHGLPFTSGWAPHNPGYSPWPRKGRCIEDGRWVVSASNFGGTCCRPYTKTISTSICWGRCWSYSTVMIKVVINPASFATRRIEGKGAKVMDVLMRVETIILFPLAIMRTRDKLPSKINSKSQWSLLVPWSFLWC